ncbi:sensor histidine kinase [Nonomuraea terrae]|uniref:sensor histidine kinase n=1 Tax=Nonomuraea terrae TaxID=2530383 RepID=UPI001CB6DB33|nr:HAMP domain-containing sensor histidine kinase [Nonomuraea terrae]
MTAWATLVAMALCALTAWFVLDSNYKSEMSERFRQVYAAALRVSHQLVHQRAVPPALEDEGVSAMQVIDPTGKVVSASSQVQGQPRMATFVPPQRPGAMDRVVCDVPGFPSQCMIIAAMWVYAPSGDFIVYGALPPPARYGSATLVAMLVAASVIWLSLVAWGTYHIVGRALRPVEAMTAELDEITATDLAHRVPVPAHHDEIRFLAKTVNYTLQLLERALQQERRFTSDASHDLRAPMAAARLRLEEALTDPGTVDWPGMAKELLSDVERQQAIADDILALARLDADRSPQHERNDLAELARTELQHRPPGRVPIHADLESGVFVACDRQLICRLLTNLLDNAQRHAATAATVAVRAEDGTGVLAVADDGAGIAPEHRELVFERFVRLPESRARDPKGTGLGLPICREIAHAHQGTLTIEDPGQGTCFVLRVPLLN